MKKLVILLSTISFCGLLGACGLKGDLYRPSAEQKAKIEEIKAEKNQEK
jgi:predicted small lipoprotein YifL